MGQKVNPIGFRLGIVERWRSNWFASDREFKDYLREDVLIRSFLRNRFPRASVSLIQIEKVPDNVRVTLYTTRPGVVLGRKGAEINRVRDELYRLLNKQVTIDVNEINSPGRSAQFIADTLAMQLERRTSHRQAVKKAMALALQSGAEGIKVRIGGRIGGAEISRSEQYMEGKVPLHTLRARVDYATATSITKSGTIGVKVWVYTGEVLDSGPEAAPESERQPRYRRRRKDEVRHAPDAQESQVS